MIVKWIFPIRRQASSLNCSIYEQTGSLDSFNKILQDVGGNLSAGAIANLVDEVGWAAIHADGHHMKVSVDMSISFMSTAKVDVSELFIWNYSFFVPKVLANMKTFPDLEDMIWDGRLIFSIWWKKFFERVLMGQSNWLACGRIPEFMDKN